jgi:excisionase family DNA binding protein
MTKPAYSVEEFCNAYAVSRSTFYRQVELGRIKANKCGSRTLVSHAAAERWLNRLPSYRRQSVASYGFQGKLKLFIRSSK